MQPDPFPAKQLSILFDRDACSTLKTWLPTDEQLEVWVLAAMSHVLCEEQHDQRIEVSLSCVSVDEIRELNAAYRSKNKATNVLSFPADMPLLPADGKLKTPTKLLGDVVVCPQVLETEAISQAKLIDAHWAHMLIHSVLHLSGFDHEDESEAQAMESLEIQILSSIGITNPYSAVSANKS